VECRVRLSRRGVEGAFQRAFLVQREFSKDLYGGFIFEAPFVLVTASAKIGVRRLWPSYLAWEYMKCSRSIGFAVCSC
jgi:hypothetical protein